MCVRAVFHLTQVAIVKSSYTVEPQRSEHQTTEWQRDIMIGIGMGWSIRFLKNEIATKWQRRRIVDQGIFLAGVVQEFGLGKSTIFIYRET